jgi:hypothetical protein
VIWYFQGLLTPVVALIAAYIAWQQFEVNKAKLRLDNYARRLRIYEEVVKILSIVTADLNPRREDLLRFRGAVAEADFQFRGDIRKYIDEIFSRGLKLRRANDEYNAAVKSPGTAGAQKAAAKIAAETNWFSEQYDSSLEMFKKYLDVSTL